jgi:type II secretory pathway predicted ATPase ExeA
MKGSVMATSIEAMEQSRIPVRAILGLDREPPGPKQVNRFFYKSPLIAQRLAMLNNLVGGKSLVLVVIGERGSGKTTLLNHFITGAGGQWRVGRIRIKARRQVPPKLWRNLNNRMVFLSRKKALPSVIIDDAHQLSPLELQVLLQYAISKDGRRRVQSIVLLAEPSMRERFAEIAHWLPPKSVIDKIFMSPFTEKQTADYLAHRLKAAGFLRDNPFSVDQIKSIYAKSGGLPGWINGEAFLLLKKISTHQSGFKKSLLMGFRRMTVGFQGRLPNMAKVSWLLKRPAFAAGRRD